MPDLDLQALPAELQAALERVWPGCPEAQTRALLAPSALGGSPAWPGSLWAWQSARRWWRPFRARDCRAGSERFFAAHVRDVRGQDYAARLFDPEQPYFETPWTHATTLLRSPVRDTFSDADFWFVTQLLFGGDVHWAGQEVERWAQGMRADGALHGVRRSRWLAEAHWRLEMSATGTYV